MKLLCAGGGSGGHVTPVLAVINELAKLDASLEVVFVCDKAFFEQAQKLMQQAAAPVEVVRIPAGKLRRYSNEPLHIRLLDIATHGKNFVDMFRILGGYWRSWRLLGRFRPDAVFAKGGYVCLPVGLAAFHRSIPLVIHDSDTKPGLTNRVLARYAAAIATGSPVENYPYDAAKTTYTGVPISAEYRVVNREEQRQLKLDIGKNPDQPLVVVTGGGLGAQSINRALVHGLDELLASGAGVYHVCGKKNYDSLRGLVPETPQYTLEAFVYKDMWKVLAAADIVVSRASATFMQELAALKKAVVAVPGAHLADQQKNALMYERAGAAQVLQDAQLLAPDGTSVLTATLLELLADAVATQTLAENLYKFARPHAAQDVARLIWQVYHSEGPPA